MNLLDVHNLTVRFGSTVVVDDVSFSVAAGENLRWSASPVPARR